MTTFKLDTSGFVEIDGRPMRGMATYYEWSDLSPFVQGYGSEMAHTLFLLLVEHGTDPEHALAAVAFRNWAPETLARIMEDCEAIQTRNLWFGQGTADHGADFWACRQRGEFTGAFHPLQVALNDAGKVVFL